VTNVVQPMDEGIVESFKMENKEKNVGMESGCKVRWVIFLSHNVVFCKVLCIYILLTHHKINNILNLWLDFQFK
jgi:hypothetical protein